MMKKFLSSLLALTMILSLVIVPANASGNTISGVSITPPSATLKVGDSQQITVSKPQLITGNKLTVNDQDITLSDTPEFTVSGFTSSNIKVVTVSQDSAKDNLATATAVGAGTATISCTVTCNYKYNDGVKNIDATATQTLTTEITVEPPVTYTYEIGGSVAVTTPPATGTYKSGDKVTFTADPSKVTVTKKGSDKSETTVSADEYTLSYSWTGAKATDADKSKAEATLTTSKREDKLEVTCEVTATFKSGSDTISGKVLSSKMTINFVNQAILDAEAKAQADFEKAVTDAGFTYKGRATSLSGSVVTYKPYVGETASYSDFALASAISGFGTVNITKKGDNGFTVSGTKDSTPVSVDFTFKASTAPSVTFTTTLTTGNVTAATVQKDGTITVTAKANNVTNPSYRWTVNGASGEGDAAKIVFDKDKYTKNKGTVTAICNVYENNDFTKPAAQNTFTLTVSDEACTLKVQPEKLTFAQTGSSNYQTLTATLYKTENNQQKEVTTGVTYSFKASDDSVIGFSKSSNPARVYLKKQDNATITVTATFEGKTYTQTVEVKGALLNASLDKVENGGNLEFDYNDLEKAANEALPGRVTVNDDKPITLSDIPTRDSDGGMIYDGNHKVTGNCRIDDDDDDLEFRAANGFVGDAKMTMTVTGDDGKTYVITLAIPVTMREAKFDDQVTGGESSYKVSVPDGYKAYSVLGVNKAPDSDKYNKTWTIRNAEYSGSSLYSVKSTDLKDGEVKLYIVAIDDDGKAYSGTLTVTANSYSIKYNVVAGESVDFKQAHFEDFLDSAFKDQSSYSYKDYSAKFDYVKFSSTSSGSSTNGWQLYDGSSKVKTSDKIKDLDDISFSAGSKLTGTVKINFTLYADITKDSTGRTAKEDMPFSGTIEVTVIKEDIVYEVGVNSYVAFDSSAFLKYVQSAVSKSTKLDYVTFDVGKNGVISSVLRGTGALYASYSTYGSKIYANSTDKFYYEPGKNQDALDSVTYATTSYAKAGDIVYIPFTAVTSAKKEVTGTVAIKVKQTMNFVDVHTYDYFYDAVQWAVNNDITKGTSTTTFSPKTGCTRAQIVTFLWRAAGSHEPRSSYNKFTDVTTSHADYMKAIIWATEQGITTGTSATTFSPDATCTRAQIVTFLYRFKNSPAVYGSVSFSDVNKAEHGAYYNAILWASNNKIATGYNNIFNPNGTCNRGDAVTFLYRALA